MKNPAWTRDELILALDLYFREPSSIGSKTHPAVAELSDLLNRLPIHDDKSHGQTYRNPNGVAMKLSNFLRFDPSYSGRGLERGNKLEREVWDEFSGDHVRLHGVAAAIRENSLDKDIRDFSSTILNDEEAVEGRVLTRVHNYRERDPSLIRKKKSQVLNNTEHLACDVCGFDFKEVYGELGDGFAECHHTKPVSELVPGEKTRLQDLAIVCANCHRMIHRSKPWLTIDQLSMILHS